MRAYAEAVSKLATEVAENVATSLSLNGGDFFKEWTCQFRMNKYSFTLETVGSTGLGIHTDRGLLSILQDDEAVSGLEVADTSGSFIPVDSSPGTFIVNLGDMAVVRQI